MQNRPFLKEVDSKIEKVEISNYKKAVFILHDQLNLEVWPKWMAEEKPLLIFIETAEKGKSLPYHKKKLIFLLSSMRHFALECSENGFPVLYQSSDSHYDAALSEILNQNKELELLFMQPSEWDSRERLHSVMENFSNRVKEIPNSFFLADSSEYVDKIKPGYRMEYFYRDMRKKTGYLMDGENPERGEWNYDEQNREKLPKNHPIPEIKKFEPDEITKEVTELIDSEYSKHIGESADFWYAVSREQALEKLDEFIKDRLDEFGPYEDALVLDESILFHSHLALYMNNGLLLPKEVCDKAQEAYKNGNARLNSVEGFIRQIIGWREFVKVYYEAMMPEVRDANYFNFKNKLPEMYWSGNTEMKCMSESIKPVLKDGYSHHIPRLMVLSNFSNLTETNPIELNEWFWFSYVDAYEWVVLPNVLGMSTFADGGVLASKPYVAGGNYINKMSNYCSKCAYNIKEKTGDKACPFNYLYWNFIDKQRETFMENGRASFMVNMFDKRSEEDKKEIRESSSNFIKSLKRI